jgi:predicted negative regulator of RcsB-dependent stress response
MIMIIRLILVLVILVVVYVNGYINNYNRYSNSNIMKSLRYNKFILSNQHKYNQQNAILTKLSANNIIK